MIVEVRVVHVLRHRQHTAGGLGQPTYLTRVLRGNSGSIPA